MKRLIITSLFLTISLGLFSQTFNINFDHIELEIDNFSSWNQDELDKNIYSKDVIVLIELGFGLEGKLLQVKKSDLTNLSIEQRVETSVTIMDEGPHCDLTEWKNYTSEWESLKEVKPNTFLTKHYSDDITSRFPSTTSEELISAVQKFCGERWSSLLNENQSIDDYPSSVSVSKYFLRIRGKDSNGGWVEYIITFDNPMGC